MYKEMCRRNARLQEKQCDSCGGEASADSAVSTLSLSVKGVSCPADKYGPVYDTRVARRAGLATPVRLPRPLAIAFACSMPWRRSTLRKVWSSS